jgi:hypothetical protein
MSCFLKRDLREKNLLNFSNSLKNVIWNDIFMDKDVNNNWLCFYDKILKLFDYTCPMSKIKIHNTTNMIYNNLSLECKKLKYMLDMSLFYKETKLSIFRELLNIKVIK